MKQIHCHLTGEAVKQKLQPMVRLLSAVYEFLSHSNRLFFQPSAPSKRFFLLLAGHFRLPVHRR